VDKKKQFVAPFFSFRFMKVNAITTTSVLWLIFAILAIIGIGGLLSRYFKRKNN